MKYLKRMIPLLLAGMLLTGCGPYAKGADHLEKGEYEQAEEAFTKAIDKKENLAESYRGLGIALWEQKEYEACVNALKAALENGGKETAAIDSMIANCAMELGNYPEAVQFYVLGINGEGASDELMQEMEFNLIAAYEKQGELELAKEKLAEYVKKYPDDEKAAKEALFLETR